MQMRLALIFAALAVGSCDSEEAGLSKNDQEDSVTACVERGVAYFKEIGSYPTLQAEPNTGRAAEEVALERCQRTTTAF